jgi:hydroxyacylglutathione hydrolase
MFIINEIYPIRTSFAFFKNYTYLIQNNKTNTCIIVDPAWNAHLIEKRIDDLRTTVSAVLLTHSHFDHTNLAEYFAKKYDCGVFMNEDEVNFYDYKCKNLRPLSFGEKDVIIGGTSVFICHTPGHTKGSSCYLIGDNLFTGDTLFIEGCGICNGKGADPSSMYYSFLSLKSNISDNVLIFPGHSFGEKVGQPFEHVKKNNIYLNIIKKEHFIDFRMRKNPKAQFSFK